MTTYTIVIKYEFRGTTHTYRERGFENLEIAQLIGELVRSKVFPECELRIEAEVEEPQLVQS